MIIKRTSLKPAEIWKGNVCYYQRSTWSRCDLHVTLSAPLHSTALDKRWIKMQAIKDVYKSDRAMAQAVCSQLPHKPGFDPCPVSVGGIQGGVATSVYPRNSVLPSKFNSTYAPCHLLLLFATTTNCNAPKDIITRGNEWSFNIWKNKQI